MKEEEEKNNPCDKSNRVNVKRSGEFGNRAAGKRSFHNRIRYSEKKNE